MKKRGKCIGKTGRKLHRLRGKMGQASEIFNVLTALLAKQIWRIMINPNLLVSKVVKGRYFPHTSILEAKKKQGAFWIWPSLHSSIGLLENGLRKQVGNDKSIWKHGKSHHPQTCNLEYVADLIQNCKWNDSLVSSLFSEKDRKLIMKIPLSLV